MSSEYVTFMPVFFLKASSGGYVFVLSSKSRKAVQFAHLAGWSVAETSGGSRSLTSPAAGGGGGAHPLVAAAVAATAAAAPAEASSRRRDGDWASSCASRGFLELLTTPPECVAVLCPP